MKDTEILETVEAAKRDFGQKCGKYSGAVTVEIIRHALQEEGISVSARDVFIRGVPIELDLVIPRKGVSPQDDLLYESSQVLVAIEVKNSGSFGEKTIQTVERNAAVLRAANPQIAFCYLTLSEREGYPWALTEKNAPCKTYTLFWHKGSGARKIETSTGDWQRFLDDMWKIQKKA
jgi:hypothetical protein